MDVKIRDLTMRYGDNVAVRDLDFDIVDGELLVLLGPSGCGKTTTMRCIVGLETATSGTIEIGEQRVFDAAGAVNVPANKRNIGMVFQSYAIWPHLTVFQNVSFPLRMKKRPRKEITERTNEVLRLVGLDGFERRSASLLSGGQMQRVALARSLVMQPRMLLLDEPLSNLDAQLREKLRFELREIQQSLGITTVYVTHDQSEALALADRIALMRDGVVVQLGDPVELYTKPNCVFAAQFLGVENIFAGAVEEDGDGDCRVRLADSDLVLTAGSAYEKGTEIHVCIRPEEINLSTTCPEDLGNVVTATVQAASFLGDRIRYHLSLPDGRDLYATSAEKRTPLPPRTRVFAHVPPDQVQLLRD